MELLGTLALVSVVAVFAFLLGKEIGEIREENQWRCSIERERQEQHQLKEKVDFYHGENLRLSGLLQGVTKDRDEKQVELNRYGVA